MAFAPQYQNLVMSSFLLWLNNLLIQKGGYQSVNTQFYPNSTVFNGFTVFSAPFKPIIYSNSHGINVMTGVYFNNSFLTLNTSGYAGIDYNRGNIYFTGANTPSFNNATVSGSYTIPEYNILYPSPDINLVIEGKMNLVNRGKSSYNAPNTGIKPNEITYPCIMVKSENFSNTPFELGGTDLTKTVISLSIFSDNLYSFDCLRSFLADEKTNHISLLNTGEMPTNAINSLRNGQLFNYTGVANLNGHISSGSALYIEDVIITNFNKRGLFSEVAALPTDCWFGVAEFELSLPRLT